MTERILVFKGDEVVYNNLEQEILCVSEDECFYIKDVPPDKILARDVKVEAYPNGLVLFSGTELWSDGEKWIIEKWRPR